MRGKCRHCGNELPDEEPRKCKSGGSSDHGLCEGDVFAEPDPECRACGEDLEGKPRVQDGDEYVCLGCYGVTPRTCERVHHVEVSGEHRLCIPGVVEATTRNWGIAKVFAETLVTIAAEGR